MFFHCFLQCANISSVRNGSFHVRHLQLPSDQQIQQTIETFIIYGLFTAQTINQGKVNSSASSTQSAQPEVHSKR
ncbi:N-benzoylphenylalaninol synthetase apmA [Trichinella pseudospiralis]